MDIRSNNQPRDILYWHELTAREQREFDYLDTEQRQAQATFARYRGHIYDLSEFTVAPADMKPWQGIAGDSYFSGVLVRYVDDYERVIMGTYFS